MSENDIRPRTIKITANEYSDLYSLRQEIDYFTFNCVRCGKKVIKKYWKKYHIPKYAKCICQSCIVHENQLNMSDEARKNTRIKALNTIHHRYGQEYSSTSQLAKTKEKAKLTFMNKYGVDNPMKLSEIKEKSELTFLKNHNGLSQREYFKTDEFQNKVKSIKANKYGDPNYNNKDKISATKQNYTLKRKEDILAKYHKTINNKSEEEKIREYNNRCNAQLNRSKESYKIAKEKEKNTNLLLHGDENYRNTENA